MKPRIRKTLNFFAFNILFFSFYLNFIQSDRALPASGQNQTAFYRSAGMTLQHPEKHINKPGFSEDSWVQNK